MKTKQYTYDNPIKTDRKFVELIPNTENLSIICPYCKHYHEPSQFYVIQSLFAGIGEYLYTIATCPHCNKFYMKKLYKSDNGIIEGVSYALINPIKFLYKYCGVTCKVIGFDEYMNDNICQFYDSITNNLIVECSMSTYLSRIHYPHVQTSIILNHENYFEKNIFADYVCSMGFSRKRVKYNSYDLTKMLTQSNEVNVEEHTLLSMYNFSTISEITSIFTNPNEYRDTLDKCK